MVADVDLARGGRPAELFGVVERYGDPAMDFIWRNKGALATAAVLAAFLVDPQPSIDGTRDLAGIAADAAVRPVAHVPSAIAREAAARMDWTLLGVCAVGATAIYFGVRQFGRRRRAR